MIIPETAPVPANPDAGTEPVAMTFDSAERLVLELAPPDYRPLIAINDYMVHDDDLEDLDPGPWRHFFNGGSNGFHFVRADMERQLWFVHQFGASYEYAGPDAGGRYASAYDAFYAADQLIAQFDQP